MSKTELKPFGVEKKNKKRIIVSSAIFFAVAIILLAVSYSLYQKQDEGTLADGTARYPDASEVSYTTDKNEDVETVEDALNDLYTILGGE